MGDIGSDRLTQSHLPASSFSSGGKRGLRDRLLVWLLVLLTVCASAVTLLIFYFLLREAWPLLLKQSPLNFFSDSSWHPTEGKFNLLPIILGSIYATLGAILLAAPLSLAAALFCRFYAPPWLAQGYRIVIELMAGIPSVVYGFWGLVVLVPIIAGWQGPGTSLLAGILVLSLMIMPTGALLADAALEKLPRYWWHGSQALGLSRQAYIRRIAIPAASSGLVNALLLQTGRALGETMAVLMVCGNIVQIPTSLLQPVRTLSANIALEMAYAMDEHRAALYCSGLILLLLATLLAFGAHIGSGNKRVQSREQSRAQ